MTNTNTSATGGPLIPSTDSPVPLEGQALLRFLQQWVVGISGLPGNMVRPYWQGQPPNIPAPSTVSGYPWCALGVKRRPSDTFPVLKHLGSAWSGEGEDELIRHEELELLLSFYDEGVEGQADWYMAQTRDGTAVLQNHYVLYNAGFGWGKCDAPIVVPSLLKERWLYRVDLPMMVRRAVVRTYPVRNLLEAVGEFFTTPSRGDGTVDVDGHEDWVAQLSDT